MPNAVLNWDSQQISFRIIKVAVTEEMAYISVSIAQNCENTPGLVNETEKVRWFSVSIVPIIMVAP